MPRTIAIGDIHGCATALATLLRAIQLEPDDTLVTLGDYVDRGPDSAGVLEQMIAIGRRCRHIALVGNHEEMMVASRTDATELKFWLRYGGQQTLDSYGPEASFEQVPAEHWRFIGNCRTCWETDRFFFTHASYEPHLPLDRQERVQGARSVTGGILPVQMSMMRSAIAPALSNGVVFVSSSNKTTPNDQRSLL